MTPDTFSDLLDIGAAAALLGVAKSTMEEWVRTKAVASFKKGRVRRIAREDLARFVLANTVRAKRPDWLTAEVESEFRKLVNELAGLQVARLANRVETMERFLAGYEFKPALAA